ncbi:Plectin/S10 domain-containing protein [Spinellus fusiger]|nr:Plectin/S10 domain-containing protein [Spinellus fusiger]
MLISKENRKPFTRLSSRHSELEVPNLEVIKSMQSLTSKGLVKTQFSWQFYYYTLTDEGINYLREYLHLPQEIVPATMKKAVRAAAPRRPFGGEGREGARPRGDRDDYRRKEGASGDFKPEFRGGMVTYRWDPTLGRGRRE